MMSAKFFGGGAKSANLSFSPNDPGFDERLAALCELARPRPSSEEPQAREAFGLAWAQRWLQGAQPGVDRAAWAANAQAALSQRRISWLGRSHHKPSGAGNKLPRAEKAALKRAAVVYLIGLLQGDPKAFLEQARQLGGLAGLHLVAEDDPSLSGSRLAQALCRAAMALPEGESQKALSALLDLAAGCAEYGPRLSLWLAAGEAAAQTLDGAPPNAERFERQGLPALELLCSRCDEVGAPPRWAKFMANSVSAAAAKAGGAAREKAMDLVFRSIERQGGAEWLLSGFGHQELLSWISDSDEAAHIAARCFAAEPQGLDFWGMCGGFRTVMERPGGKRCARFYQAGVALFGPPTGPNRNAPLIMLFSQGDWRLACELALSDPPLSSRQAKAALNAALEGALEMEMKASTYGPSVEARLEGFDWPKALLRLAELAEPADASPLLDRIMALHPAFAVGVEKAALGQSVAESSDGARSARRLAL